MLLPRQGNGQGLRSHAVMPGGPPAFAGQLRELLKMASGRADSQQVEAYADHVAEPVREVCLSITDAALPQLAGGGLAGDRWRRP